MVQTRRRSKCSTSESFSLMDQFLNKHGSKLLSCPVWKCQRRSSRKQKRRRTNLSERRDICWWTEVQSGSGGGVAVGLLMLTSSQSSNVPCSRLHRLEERAEIISTPSAASSEFKTGVSFLQNYTCTWIWAAQPEHRVQSEQNWSGSGPTVTRAWTPPEPGCSPSPGRANRKSELLKRQGCARKKKKNNDILGKIWLRKSTSSWKFRWGNSWWVGFMKFLRE